MTDEKKTVKRKLQREHILPDLCYSSKAYKDVLVKVFKLPKPFRHECIKREACWNWIEPRWLNGHPEVGKSNPRKGQLRWTDAVKQELMVKLQQVMDENDEATRSLRSFHYGVSSKQKEKKEAAIVPEWMEDLHERLPEGTLVSVYEPSTVLLGKIVAYSKDHSIVHVSVDEMKDPLIYMVDTAHHGIRKNGVVYTLKLEEEVKKATSGKRQRLGETEEKK